MGLTVQSVGLRAGEQEQAGFFTRPGERLVAIAGNPNVGKSTVFNGLTGLRQHTGNWPGKTVSSAAGRLRTEKGQCLLVDIPGTYSLFAHSKEEEVARDFLFFHRPDGIIVVCDGTCLERNLNLVLQVLEFHDRVVVCVNLLDEAKRKGIRVDLPALSACLGVPVVGTVARERESLQQLVTVLENTLETQKAQEPFCMTYATPVEQALVVLEEAFQSLGIPGKQGRFLALRWLLEDVDFFHAYQQREGMALLTEPAVTAAAEQARAILMEGGISRKELEAQLVSQLMETAERIASRCVKRRETRYSQFDRRLDRILTAERQAIR